MSWEMLHGGSHLPKPYLVTTRRSVSYLSTTNMNFNILFFLEYCQYFICFHSRYTSQYTVPYDSLAAHNVFGSTSCTHHVQTQENRLTPLVLELKVCQLSQATRTSLSSIQLKNRLHWQSQTLSKAVQRWKKKRKLIHQGTHELILYQQYFLLYLLHNLCSNARTTCIILKGNEIQMGSPRQAQKATKVLDSQFSKKMKALPICTHWCRV